MVDLPPYVSPLDRHRDIYQKGIIEGLWPFVTKAFWLETEYDIDFMRCWLRVTFPYLSRMFVSVVFDRDLLISYPEEGSQQIADDLCYAIRMRETTEREPNIILGEE